jgi:hypothetical protein
MSEEKSRVPTHINVKKTKAVIETIQAPVRKVISKKVVTTILLYYIIHIEYYTRGGTGSSQKPCNYVTIA